MKKSLYSLVVVALVLLLVGCGNTKTLSCTTDEELMGMKTNQKVDIVYEKDKVKSLTMVIEMILPSSVESQWDATVKALDEQYETLNGEGLKVTTKNNKGKLSYTVTVEADATKATKESLDKMNLSDMLDSTKSIEEVKKEAEKSNYKCSIK